MEIISHNTDAMRDWSGNIDEQANNYDTLIEDLYKLIDQFVGSEDFKGGLSTDFQDTVVAQKPEFLKYSETFRECVDLINKTATNIDDDEADLKNNISNSNPLGN